MQKYNKKEIKFVNFGDNILKSEKDIRELLKESVNSLSEALKDDSPRVMITNLQTRIRTLEWILRED